ncbi:MAG TPA: ThuA domain-containing protein [Fimbriimonadaceae bacterium]|nr:ThuA domain-containing protein [Fimbriimonadaceae bacterium]
MLGLAVAAFLVLGQVGDRLIIPGASGPGRGKHVVLLAGDEEYRSEEGLPQLAKILAKRHGFTCTVLFSLNRDGEIDPDTQDNEPGLEALDHADACVMLLRFRHWPDEQMRHFVDYWRSGRPIVALRTSTHAFAFQADSPSPFRAFGWESKVWPGGFGKQVLGETWVSHWGDHKHQATRGLLTAAGRKSPIMRGVTELFGTTDVYEVKPPMDAEILVNGEVLAGMSASDPPATNRKRNASGIEQAVNDPMMPIAWSRRVKNDAGRRNSVFTTTMGAATDLLDEGVRRMLVNAVYRACGLERRIPKRSNVELVGDYSPSPFGFEGFKRNVRPAMLDSR